MKNLMGRIKKIESKPKIPAYRMLEINWGETERNENGKYKAFWWKYYDANNNLISKEPATFADVVKEYYRQKNDVLVAGSEQDEQPVEKGDVI